MRPCPGRDMAVTTGVLCHDSDTVSEKKKVKKNKKIKFLFIFFVFLCVLKVEDG